MSSSAHKLMNDGPVDPTPHGVPANQATVISSEELVTPEQRLSASRGRIAGILADWPDLRAQTAEARKASSGKAAARMMTPLRSLFQLAASPQWAPVFGALGVSQDAEHHVPFDAAQLLARTQRYAALQQLQSELKELTALVGDDLLHQGAQLVAAGKPAIGLARTLAKSNPTFRGKVATILNDLTAMTAGARNGAGDDEVDEVDEDEDLDDAGDAPDPKPDA
jgi:hypothetical protein